MGAPPPPPAGYQMPAAVPAGGKSGKATAALVLGIASVPLFFLLGIFPILAIIFGLLARKEIKASGGRLGGKGKATAGLVLGIVMAIATIALFVAVALDDSVQATDLEEGQCVELPDTDEEEVFNFTEQDCDGIHGGEVFFVTELDGDDYPGTSEVIDMSRSICTDELVDFLDGDPLSAGLDVLFVYPQRKNWDKDKSLACIAYRPGEDLDGGSLEGSQG